MKNMIDNAINIFIQHLVDNPDNLNSTPGLQTCRSLHL